MKKIEIRIPLLKRIYEAACDRHWNMTRKIEDLKSKKLFLDLRKIENC